MAESVTNLTVATATASLWHVDRKWIVNFLIKANGTWYAWIIYLTSMCQSWSHIHCVKGWWIVKKHLYQHSIIVKYVGNLISKTHLKVMLHWITHTHAHTHTHRHTHTDTHTDTHQTQTNSYTEHTHVHTLTQTHTCAHAYTHKHTHVHTHILTYSHTHTRIDTHTHTHTLKLY